MKECIENSKAGVRCDVADQIENTAPFSWNIFTHKWFSFYFLERTKPNVWYEFGTKVAFL